MDLTKGKMLVSCKRYSILLYAKKVSNSSSMVTVVGMSTYIKHVRFDLTLCKSDIIANRQQISKTKKNTAMKWCSFVTVCIYKERIY